jgi:S1-C subfamily serine protease
MRSIQAWAITLGLLAGGLAPPLPAAEGDNPAREIEARIEKARAQLDDAARKLAELHSEMWRLETTGPRADRPMLGILLQDAGTAAGLTLAGVTPEGGADRAGLQAGDTIIEVNGVRLDGGGDKKPLHALSEAMAPVTAGDTIPVTYVRNGATTETELTTYPRGRYMARVMEEKGPWLDSLRSLGELEDLEALQDLESLDVLGGRANEGFGDFIVRAPAGLHLEDVSGPLADYFGVESGVLVMEVPERVPALQPGDVLLSIEGEPVTDARSALRRLAASDGEVAARVLRRGEELAVTCTALNDKQALQVFRTDRRIRIQRDGDGEAVRLEIVVSDDQQKD